MVRKSRRAFRPAPPGVDPDPKNKTLDDPVGREESHSWGDRDDSNDQELLQNRPPHWAEKSNET